MLPFMEYVNSATGVKSRVDWDRNRAEAKMQTFRAEAREFFRRRDIQRARAVGIDIADDAVALPTMKLDPNTNEMVIDPIASSVKHSGAEFNDYWIPKWQEFCSKPQNYEDAEYPVVTYKSKQAAILESPMMKVTPEDQLESEPKRRGRPRKQQLAAV
jgi:hypothetical protein